MTAKKTSENKEKTKSETKKTTCAKVISTKKAMRTAKSLAKKYDVALRELAKR